MEFMTNKQPHAVCIPLPAQGHINPMLKLAKLLHAKGFHITFVHTEFNYQRLIKSKDIPSSMESSSNHHDFRFETIPDGLPPDNQRGIQNIPALCESMSLYSHPSFKQVIMKLNDSLDVPNVSCIISDGVMSFTLKVAEELGIPEILLFTPSGCAMLGYLHFGDLRERGYFPLKDESCLTNGYLDTKIDWIPAMEGIRLKDLPTFIRTTNDKDIMFNYNLEAINNALKTKSIILNTFNDLEQDVLDAINAKISNIYTIGPLGMLHNKLPKPKLNNIGSSLWKEDKKCLEWLDTKEARSVVYVNFGSLVIMTPEQMSEFAWGLVNSKYSFMWVIRPNLGSSGAEFLKSIGQYDSGDVKSRSLLVEWCPQEEVLSHRSIGVFLTHCGWNSTLECIGNGVPMLCWPFFADQQINCHYICKKWGIGMEIDVDVKRKDVEGFVREVMEGEKGKEIRRKAMELKILADRATSPGGTSYINFDMLLSRLK